MKVDATDADDGMDDLLGFIGDPDLDLDGEQESKTLRALESLVSY